MSDFDYQRCKFSITCQTNDLAVVHCLRAICQFAEKVVMPQIAWGGTKETEWLAAGKKLCCDSAIQNFGKDFDWKLHDFFR
jgi:hypothetical protein